LNTTIPVHPQIPEEYWGREVSRYIGPVTIPVRTGEDSMRIFIDSDGDRETGFTAPWLNNIGAEYMITVTGRNMEVLSANYSRYVGNGNDWEWEHVDDVDVALNHTSLETEIDLELSDDARVTFVSTDWSEVMDVASPINGRTRSKEATSSSVSYAFYLREDDALSTEMGDNELIETLENRDGMRSHQWHSSPTAERINITGNLNSILYLDPTPRGDNQPGLNVSLYDEGELIAHGELDGISTHGWRTISMEPYREYIPKGAVLTLETKLTGDPDTEALEMEVHYNSGSRNSRVSIPTNSTINIDYIHTYDEDGNETETFQEGDMIEVRTLVEHPICASEIQTVKLDIDHPDGTPLIEDVEMNMVEEDGSDPPNWRIYDHTFQLDEMAPGGRYSIDVDAEDKQGNSHGKGSSFIIPQDPGVSVHPHGEKIGDPGEDVEYSVEIKNIGNVEDEYEITAGLSSRRWSTSIYHDEEMIAEDANGDGVWDWVDPSWDSDNSGNPNVYLVQEESLDLTVIKSIPEDAVGERDDTRITASSIIFSEVHDHAELRTSTPYPVELKTLYLHADDTLDTDMGDETSSMELEDGQSNLWTQTPPMAGEFSIEESVTVFLYIEPRTAGANLPEVTTTLMKDDGVINSHTITNIDETDWYEFSIPADTTFARGEQLQLLVSVGGNDVTLEYNSEEFDARLEMNTDTYVHVESIKTYSEGEESDEFSAGDTVTVDATITDPLGSYDIEGANISLLYPDGSEMIPEEPMDHIETDPEEPSYWKKFSTEFTIPDDATVGIYEIIVTGIESNGVTSNGYQIFFVPANVTISPDHNSTADPGTTVSYEHEVVNHGGGYEFFEINIDSSMGLNVTLYGPDDTVMGEYHGSDDTWTYVNPDWDTDGDGNPDTGWLGPGDSIDIRVEIEIPLEADGEETTVITARSNIFSHQRDQAIDITVIPEFQYFLVTVIVIMVVNMIYIRLSKPGKSINS